MRRFPGENKAFSYFGHLAPPCHPLQPPDRSSERGLQARVSPLSGLSGYTVTDSGGTLTISTSSLVLKIQKTPYRLAVYKGDGTTLITQEYDPTLFRNLGWASDGSSTVTKAEEHFLTPSGEHFHGLGERYDYLDQRGQDVNNYVYNEYLDQAATHRTYLSVPFFINSAGYGIYLPSTYYSIFNIGTYRSDMAGFTGTFPTSELLYA